MPSVADTVSQSIPPSPDADWRIIAAWLEERGWKPIKGRGRRSTWLPPDPADRAVYTRAAALRAAGEKLAG